MLNSMEMGMDTEKEPKKEKEEKMINSLKKFLGAERNLGI
jgi:hypothetical protein